MLNPDFFEICISVGVIRIKSGYPVSLVPSYVIAARTSPPPTGWVGGCKHSRRPDIMRGTNWPFPLTPLSVSNLRSLILSAYVRMQL